MSIYPVRGGPRIRVAGGPRWLAARWRACHRHWPRKGEITVYPSSALSAWQLAIMALVVVTSLAAWLILVFLAARQPRSTSAAASAAPREDETAATVTQRPSAARPAGKAAA